MTNSAPTGAAWSPTRAATGDGLRFGHLHPHRRQIKHLLSLHTHLWRIRQTRTADTAAARLMPQPLIRINNLRRRRPRMPGLSTWLATTRTPQRLRRRLAKTANPMTVASTSSASSAPTVPSTQQPVPQAARSAQPAPRPEPQAPHKTDGDRQTQHNDQRPDAEINEPRRGSDQLLCLNLAALLLGNTLYR
jgi:hypothetical protein